jgi:hypothetical protein
MKLTSFILVIVASWSEEDSFESKDSAHPRRRTKRQSTSDVSIGSIGDLSVEAQSPTASGRSP